MSNRNQTRGGYPENPGMYSPDSSRRAEVDVYNEDEGMYIPDYGTWDYPPAFESPNECRSFWSTVEIPPRVIAHIHNGMNSMYNREKRAHRDAYVMTNPEPPSNAENIDDLRAQWEEGFDSYYDSLVAARRVMPKLERRYAPHYIRVGLMCRSAWNEPNFMEDNDWMNDEVLQTKVRVPGAGGTVMAGEIFRNYRFAYLDEQWLTDPEVEAAGVLIEQDERRRERLTGQ